MNVFIWNIRNHDLECCVNRSLVSYVLFADDVNSLTVLQDMLHIVDLTATDVLLEFDVDKSYGIGFEPNAGNLSSLFVGGKTLNWYNSVKYLGVHLVFGKHLRIDFDAVKRHVLSNSRDTNELIQLQLQEPYCLPILT